MANNIKGITIEIGGDTTKLQNALKGVNGDLKSTKNELKEVEKGLKLDPKNTELLAQKQQLLTKAVGETKDKLDVLKTAEAQVEQQFKNGEASEEQYRAIKREVIATEAELKNLEEQAKASNSTLAKVGDAFGTVGDKATKAGEKMMPVTAGITALGAAGVAASMELDNGYDTIITKTGATGEALENLTTVADNVFSDMPTTMINGVIGIINEIPGVSLSKIDTLSLPRLAFRWDWDNNPFHLLGLDGIYGYDCNVTTSENTTTDGSTYQGSTAKERNIVITAEIDGDYRKNRELLYRVFPKGRTGTLEYSEDGDVKTITYRVESVTPGATTGVVRDYTISLICTDPYFKDLSDVEVVMASWVSDWYFENGFDINGVEFGHREAELVKEIENNNGADNIGITAIFRADGIVKNPAIYHSESGKYIKVGYTGNDFELQSGQYVVIFTHTGKKNIYLLDGVSQAEIEEHKDRYGMIDWDTVVSMYGTIINQYLDEDGDFIQLQDGTNTITYNAESGINYLSVSVYYRISYLGV